MKCYLMLQVERTKIIELALYNQELNDMKCHVAVHSLEWPSQSSIVQVMLLQSLEQSTILWRG